MRKEQGKDSENLLTVTTKSIVTPSVTSKPPKAATSSKPLGGKRSGRKNGKNKSGSKNGKGSKKGTEDTPDFDWSCVEAKKGSRATSSKALAKKLRVSTSSTAGGCNQNNTDNDNNAGGTKSKKKKVKKRRSSNKQATDSARSSTRGKKARSNKVRRRSKDIKKSKRDEGTRLAIVSESEALNDDRPLKQSITSMLESSKLHDDEDGADPKTRGDGANLVDSVPRPLSPKASGGSSAPPPADALRKEPRGKFPSSPTDCARSRSSSASGEDSSTMSESVMSESGWSDAVSSSDDEGSYE